MNPQQQQAAAQGQAVPPVTDPAGFKADVTTRLNPYIDQVLPGAQRIQSAAVVLGMPELQSLATVAQQEVGTFYGTYLSAATHSPVEQARRRRLPVGVPPAPRAVRSNPGHGRGGAPVGRVQDAAAGCGPPRGLSRARSAGRARRGAFLEVRDQIFDQRTADLRTIILFFPGYEAEGEAYIQPRLPAEYSGQDPQDTRRRGRWHTLGTVIHEMLHAVAHEDFSDGVSGLEKSGIAVEGFAEYLTRPVYAGLAARAAMRKPCAPRFRGSRDLWRGRRSGPNTSATSTPLKIFAPFWAATKRT